MKKKKYYFYIWRPKYFNFRKYHDWTPDKDANLNSEWRTLPGLDAELRRREMWGDEYEYKSIPYVPLYMGMSRSPFLDIELMSGVNIKSKSNIFIRTITRIKNIFN